MRSPISRESHLMVNIKAVLVSRLWELQGPERIPHLPSSTALAPRRGMGFSPLPTTQGCQSLKVWELLLGNLGTTVPGIGLPELGESGLWWFCFVCRSQISSVLHRLSPLSSHQLREEQRRNRVIAGWEEKKGQKKHSICRGGER